MGFTLCGLAVEKNFSYDIGSLLGHLNIRNNKALGESTFDEINLKISDDDRIAVGFFGNGTLLMTGIEFMTNDKLLTVFSADQSIVAFYINDITSTYCFDFYRNGECVRKKWISLSDEGIDSTDNFGLILEVEKLEGDDQGVIFKLISSLLGVDFFEIEEDAHMLVFEIVKPVLTKDKIEKKGFWKRLFS